MIEEGDALCDAGEAMSERSEALLGEALMQHADEHYARTCRLVNCKLVAYARTYLLSLEYEEN